MLLETREGRPSPVIVDFGKNVLKEKAKNPAAKLPHIRGLYQNNFIAPELVDGTGKPSVSSDVYSLAFMTRSLYKLLNFNVNATVKNALATACESRPSVRGLKESLCLKLFVAEHSLRDFYAVVYVRIIHFTSTFCCCWIL